MKFGQCDIPAHEISLLQQTVDSFEEPCCQMTSNQFSTPSSAP